MKRRVMYGFCNLEAMQSGSSSATSRKHSDSLGPLEHVVPVCDAHGSNQFLLTLVLSIIGPLLAQSRIKACSSNTPRFEVGQQRPNDNDA